MSRMPAAEVEVDAATLRALIADQFPALGRLPLTRLDNGWDNHMWRIGDALVARLPRRAVAVDLLEHERRYLPRLAPHLPLPVPAYVHHGAPGHGYPWPWLIIPRFAGDNADRDPPRASEAPRLAAFLRALHRPDDGPDDARAPRNAHRDVPLAVREPTVLAGWATVAKAGEPLDPVIRAIWDAAKALATPPTRRWLHGDLHYRNILIDDGIISAVIDWGDICAGDPATDLAALWILFADADARRAGLIAYGADAALALRAMGWAVSFATVLLASGLADDPRHAAAGRRTFARLLTDWAAMQP